MATFKSIPIKLSPISETQKIILDDYRLTDEFRKAYGEYLLNNKAYQKDVQKAIQSMCKFGGYDHLDLEKDRDLIIDFLYTKNILQFQSYEYFVYQFKDKPISERLTFIQGRFQDSYHVRVNKKAGFDLLRDKYKTYQTLKEYFKRDVLLIADITDLGLFSSFVKSHDRFIVKPINANSGSGVQIIDKPESLNNLFHFVRQNAPFLAEELIEPSDEFKSIYPRAVNTVRFYTFLCGDGTVKPFMAFLRAGQGNMIVDNMGAGGMMCLVDAKTGIIYTNAVDENCREYVTHPDTGFKFNGYQLPAWSELLDITLKIGAMIPDARFIGWDCTYSKNRGWQIVEGNGYGTLSLMQMPIHSGLKETVETFFSENY